MFISINEDYEGLHFLQKKIQSQNFRPDVFPRIPHQRVAVAVDASQQRQQREAKRSRNSVNESMNSL